MKLKSKLNIRKLLSKEELGTDVFMRVLPMAAMSKYFIEISDGFESEDEKVVSDTINKLFTDLVCSEDGKKFEYEDGMTKTTEALDHFTIQTIIETMLQSS